MRAFVLLTPFMLWLMLLASCSSPPKPPSVDDTRRRPVNSPMAVELQTCRHDLQNSRLQASESSRLNEMSTATLAALAALQRQLAGLLEDQDRQVQANSVFIIRFEFGSTRVDMAEEQARPLIEQAKAAPLVTLRGRTDGATDSVGESRVARDRAAAVRDYLIAAGVDPARIRSTYQPVGDHVVDNTGMAGRALNRRVEVEIYRSLPVITALGHADR